jgi:hypothetical protein
VALIGAVLIDGFAGWLAWRLVHLVRITSFRNKLATALDWTVGYLYDEDTARLEIEPSYRAQKGGNVNERAAGSFDDARRSPAWPRRA